MSDKRERIAAQVLAAVATRRADGYAIREIAEDSVRYADALIAALGEPEAAIPAVFVCVSANYRHPTGRDFYLTRNGVGGYSWIARDGGKTLDTGSAATEREAIAQAVAAVERG